MNDTTAWTPATISPETAFEQHLRLTVANGDPSKRTLSNYRAGFQRFLGWATEVRVDPRTATMQDLQLYREFLVRHGYKRQTIALLLVSVRTLYTAMQQLGVRRDNPASTLHAPGAGTEPRPSMVNRTALSVEETRALLKALPATMAPQDVRDATMVRLILFHGLRLAEISGLTAADLDFRSFSTLRVNGKGRKERTLVLCASARQDLIDWAQVSGHPHADRVVSTPSGNSGVHAPLFFRFDEPGCKQLGTRTIERVVESYLIKAGLKKPGRCVHALRHTYGVLAKLGGADDIALMESMGHSSLTTTVIYTRAAAQWQANPGSAVEKALKGAGGAIEG